tara:strand:- start:22 stop:435 length:414 start_codon:yes stop_codon:yes gene_type:complete
MKCCLAKISTDHILYILELIITIVEFDNNPINWNIKIRDLLQTHKYKLNIDGWSLLQRKYFTDAGFPSGFVETLVQNHQVNESPFAYEMEGILYLHFLYGLKSLLGIKGEISKIGRGSQAREIVELIQTQLEIEDND